MVPVENNKPYSNLSILTWVLIAFFGAVMLYFGKVIFVPVLFGLLVALIVYPVCKKLEGIGLSRSISISLLLTLIVGAFVALIWLLAVEINIIVNDLPRISTRLLQLSPGLIRWAERSLGLGRYKQADFAAQFTAFFNKNISAVLMGIFNATMSTIVMLIMIPIYSALFLYHRETFIRYLELIIKPQHHRQLHLILHESVHSYFKFVKGNFYVYCIVGLLNFLGLFALGIQHAFLYGMLTSFMMVIPYVGIFISAAIPVSIALVTKDSIWYPIAVIAIFVFVQYLESNVIFPRVVGAQLNLSTWSTLIALVAATVIWGIAGMILITPFLSILKIITDNVPEWKALNVFIEPFGGL